ncbi:hypothetical protein FOZ60_007311 [Perkinsus olseni]|uniref:RING-type E3 ubiquitin transferase n=1 Tax=Perkinsus olseni TaxID=32597 RepID=A0A7J6NMW3_PEROL|nr:hypothetical protein FOZ60_007311 [Perkinsus olseni]
MYWREQASPQEAMNPTYHQTHKIPPGQWNLSVSTCDPSPRSNFEARDDDDASTEEQYYVGRPLFRGQENCTYFSPRQEDTHYETADRFGFINSREASPPFTPCATGARDIDGDFWEDSDLRTAKNFCEPREYEDTRGFYLSIEVDDHGGDNNDHVYAANWAPAATPDSYGVYPPSMPDGYYNRRYDPREDADEARRYFHRGFDYDFYRDYNFYQSEGSGQGDHYEVDKILVCAICNEDIIASGRRFGLLENCSHPFCLECIRKWRDQKGAQDRSNLRLCPLCRVESFLITPSERFLPDGPEKREVIRGYKEALSRIPCKFVMAGEECPFGSSCYYKHSDDDDDWVDAGEKREKRFLHGADGKVQCLRNPKLSDFLFPSK